MVEKYNSKVDRNTTEFLSQDSQGSELLQKYGRIFLGRPGSVRRPLAFLIIAVIIASIISPAFHTLTNAKALLTSSSFLVIIAVGEAFVVLVGGIDLGVQSVLASSGMMLAWLFVLKGMSTALALIITLLFGIIVGFMTGILVTRGRIPSFIVTLGNYWGFRGIALLFNGGNYISPAAAHPPRPFGFSWVAGQVYNIPTLIIIMVVVVIFGEILLSMTPLGTRIKATGSNEEAAKAVGLSTSLIKIFVFVISSFLASLSGIMITAWQDSIYPLTGQGYSLQAIAGVILGGIPFSGGRGTIVGAAIGALVIGIINDMIVLVGLPAQYEYIFVAIILVLAGLQARGGPFVK